MTFESLSKNPLILPGACWMALPIVLWFSLRRRGFLRAWSLVFGLAIGLDAWLNGVLSPLAEGSAWSTASGVAFVVLGDFRMFLAAEWDGRWTSFARALAIAWFVPLGSQALRALVPAIAATPRVTYLAYELLFLVVVAGWWLVRVRRWSPERRAFATRLTRFFGLQYALWATADVVLLAARGRIADLGFGLRLLPDLLYYVGFVPWVLSIAPPDDRAPSSA